MSYIYMKNQSKAAGSLQRLNFIFSIVQGMETIGSVLVDILKLERDWVCEHKLHKSLQLHGLHDLTLSMFRAMNIMHLVRGELRKRKERLNVRMYVSGSRCMYKLRAKLPSSLEIQSLPENQEESKAPAPVHRLFRNRWLSKLPSSKALAVKKIFISVAPRTEAFASLLAVLTTAVQGVKTINLFNPTNGRRVCVKTIHVENDRVTIDLSIGIKMVSQPFFAPLDSENKSILVELGRRAASAVTEKIPLGVLFSPWFLTEPQSLRDWMSDLGRHLSQVADSASMEALCTNFATKL